MRGERHECYAITEEGAGSDVDAIVSTARRDGDEYVLNGTKMHVTSYNSADWIFFQAKLAGGDHEGEHALFFVEKDTAGVRLLREPRYTHTYPDTHAFVAFEDVRVRPGTSWARRATDVVHPRVVPLRAPDDRARCCGAMERLIEEATAFAKDGCSSASRSSSSRRSGTCWRTHRRSCGRRG